MKFSVLAIAGLAVFGGNYGAHARAVPKDLTARSSPLPVSNFDAYAVDIPKRAVGPPPVRLLPPPNNRVGNGFNGETEETNGASGDAMGPVQPTGPVIPMGQQVPKAWTQGNPNRPKYCSRSLKGRADCVTVPTIEDLMTKMAFEPDGSLFYSGPDVNGRPWIQAAYNWKLAKQPSRKIIQESFIDPQYTEQFGPMGSPDSPGIFWDRASEAMARLSKGVVYVALPARKQGESVTDFHGDTVWANTEYPALKLNPNVSKIIRVDAVTGVEETMWERTTTGTTPP